MYTCSSNSMLLGSVQKMMFLETGSALEGEGVKNHLVVFESNVWLFGFRCSFVEGRQGNSIKIH